MSELSQHTMVPPPPPSTPDPVKVGFATQWIPDIISQGVGDFTNMIVSGHGQKAFADAWNQLCELNLPAESRLPATGIEIEHFTEASRLIVAVRFLPANLPEEPMFGVIVIGPCNDPRLSEETRQSLLHRYFILFRGAEGTFVEEWTMDPPLPYGTGPKPDQHAFIEWVLDLAVRSNPDRNAVPPPNPEEDVAAAIERARSELPGVVRRFVAGELQEFSVKVAIKDGEITEHFWLAQTTFDNGYLCGVIDSNPESV